MTYNSLFIITDDDCFIPLKNVESMKLPDREDMVIDKLKDDPCMTIRTLSGKEYSMRMNDRMMAMLPSSTTKHSAMTAVFSKWCHIVVGGSV